MKLFLQCTSIGVEGGKALLHAMDYNSTITCLDLNENELDEAVMGQIDALVNANESNCCRGIVRENKFMLP